MDFKIGVIIDSFKGDFRTGVEKAAKVGAQGIQVYAVRGEMDPDNLTPDAIKEKKAILDANGLSVAALCGDLGGHGFEDEAENSWKIEKSKRIVELGLALGTNIVTTHIGLIPEDINSLKYETMLKACGALAEYADSVKAHFAVETGPEPCARMKTFLDKLNSRGVAINFDPANLVMVADDDPVAGVDILSNYIVHTHAKDGRLLKYAPDKIYGTIEGDMEQDKYVKYYEELPLGEGSVDFDGWLKALDSIGYHGYLTIEREAGDNPEKDIADAVVFLRSKIK